MQTEERKVDWEQIKRCFALIDKTSKDFLRQALLIGGAACLFYRHQLFKAADLDFFVASPNPNEKDLWLSRDIDFTGVFSQDALDMLPHHVVQHEGRKFIVVDGVRFGFTQAGVTFDPAEAIENAWLASFIVDGRKVEFLVADPVTLYFEKLKLCVQRGNANDHLHKKLLFDYIAYELVRGGEKLLKNPTLSIAESKMIIQRWTKVKNKTPEILQDKRVWARLSPLLADKPNHLLSRYLADAQV